MHDYIKDKYSNKLRSLYTDADSLINKIKTEDVYEEISKYKKMYNFSYCSAKPKW